MLLLLHWPTTDHSSVFFPVFPREVLLEFVNESLVGEEVEDTFLETLLAHCRARSTVLTNSYTVFRISGREPLCLLFLV